MELKRTITYITLYGIGILNSICLMFSFFTAVGIKEGIDIYNQPMPIFPFLMVLGMGLLSIILPYSIFKLGETFN